MSSKDKSLTNALKDMFKRNRGNTGSYTNRSDIIYLSDDLLKDLGKSSPLSTRLRVMKDLSSKIVDGKLENHGVEKLWVSVEDLLHRDSPAETRHQAFQFLQCLIKGRTDKLGLMRAQFFRFIKNHDHPDDVAQRLELLITLTNNGKELVHFEEEVGPFLLNWINDVARAGKLEEYLSMIDILIKFNAAYVVDEVITGFIQHICVLCCNNSNSKIVLLCLEIMSSIVAYGNMLPESLPKFVGALCRTVNIEEYCAASWKVMKTLLGTHMGHSTLFTMCRILQEPTLRSDTGLLRGAVFYIHMALWSSNPLGNLHFPPSSVLPSYLQAIKCNQVSVAYEVVFGIQQLVHRLGPELQDPAWSILMQIFTYIIRQIDLSSNQTPNKLTLASLHQTLNNIEHLMEIGAYNGSVKQFFCVIEECSNQRPENSLLRLISFLSQSIVPTEYLWLTNLYNLLQKYLKPDVKTNIQLKVLDILSNVVKLNRRIYEEELIDRIVIPHMTNTIQSNDVILRSSVANLLIDLCMDCESKKCLELLDILEKLLFRPFDTYSVNDAVTSTHQSPTTSNESKHSDIECLVNGLIRVFAHKIHKLPSWQAIKIFKMLVRFLEMHYTTPKVFEACPSIRRMIFDCFLKMRADSHYHLGCPYNGKMRYSSYLCVTYDQKNIDKSSGGSLSSSPPPPLQPTTTQPQSPGPIQHTACTVTYVSLRRVFKVFITCLNLEKDWEVLNLVLRGTTKVLQNKSLILSKQGNSDLDLLVDVLCAMITDKSMNLPESLNVKVTKPDFHAFVVSVIVNLASYHNYLDQIHQQKMIRCLVKCANTTGPKSPKHCIAALSICTLEMRDAMVKLLPEVLLNLSKISATVQISIPVLEFLSTLTQLPMVFGSFVADQYMAVFAISLPYTNPFRYNHYTVSLAHHVIAVWFLKCRVPFRKDFVKFITNGLQTNVLVPFEETKTIFNQNLSELNQDSSDRKRSSSLTEQGSRRRASTVSSMRLEKPAPPQHQRHIPDKNVTIFYEELTETCIDLMARYAFSPCSALPRRLPAAEFFLKGGQSMCWMVGNKLVTVTTSGCSQKILKNGLCDKCWTLCNTQNEGRQSKRGSNETDEIVGWASRQNSNEKSNNASLSSPSEEVRKIGEKLEMVNNKLQNIAGVTLEEKESCACWCSGWAEIYVRRPTGDMSWVMRIQNQITFTHSIYEFPLNEISTLFMPSLYPKGTSRGKARPPLRRQSSEDGVFNADDERQSGGGISSLSASNNSLPGSPRQSPSRQNSRDSVAMVDEQQQHLLEGEDYVYYDDGTKSSRNPVRRSNSSPEMSSSWKNPFLHHHHHHHLKMTVNDTSGVDDSIIGGADEDNNKSSKNKMYSKDMRVSCEAIPEEIAGSGTTPPSSTTPLQSSTSTTTSTTFTPSHHPSLLSCHSYPGSSSPPSKDNSAAQQKPYQTVPPSPNAKLVKAPEFLPRNTATISRPMTLTEGVVRPPHSPTTTTQSRPLRQMSTTILPREKEIHEIQKSSSSSIIEKNSSNMSLNLAREKAKERKNSGSMERLSSDNQQAQKRDRLHTISVMSPATRKPRENTRQSARSKEVPKSGINPSFVFLQLYHAAYFGNKSERPIVVENTDVVMRAMKVLDSIAPYETHKIGLVYVRDGQNNNEAEIYKNKFGSLRYVEFLQNLGTMVKLADVDPQVFFLGGLDQHGNDGKFAYIWQDDVIRVMFHVATMMPNKESDPNCNNKKLHIANDYVTIVYHESEEDFSISTIKGQLTFACVIIQPLDHGINRVTVKVKEELVDLLPCSEPKLVSDQNVAILARQLSLHANLASLVKRSLDSNHGDPYASNWLERLRRIKQVRYKVLQEQKHEDNLYQIDDSTGRNKKQMEDFTDYT